MRIFYIYMYVSPSFRNATANIKDKLYLVPCGALDEHMFRVKPRDSLTISHYKLPLYSALFSDSSVIQPISGEGGVMSI